MSSFPLQTLQQLLQAAAADLNKTPTRPSTLLRNRGPLLPLPPLLAVAAAVACQSLSGQRRQRGQCRTLFAALGSVLPSLLKKPLCFATLPCTHTLSVTCHLCPLPSPFLWKNLSVVIFMIRFAPACPRMCTLIRWWGIVLTAPCVTGARTAYCHHFISQEPPQVWHSWFLL